MNLFPVLFAVYWSSVLVWFLLASRLCEGLRSRHPLLYDALGRPAMASGGGGEMAGFGFYELSDSRMLGRAAGAIAKGFGMQGFRPATTAKVGY